MNSNNSANTLNPISRRSFLALSGAVPAALLAQAASPGAFAAPAPAAEAAAAAVTPKKYPIGLELYSVRTELARDLPNTLKTVAGIGNEVVEFYAPYYDWAVPHAKDVRSLMDDLGLRCYSTHNHIKSFTPGDGMGKAIELNQILGAKILVLASAPNGVRGLDAWKKLCEQLSRASDQLKTHGLAAGFHNHQTDGRRWTATCGQWTCWPPTLPRNLSSSSTSAPAWKPLLIPLPGSTRTGLHPHSPPERLGAGAAAQEKSYRVLFAEGVCPWKAIIAAAEATGGVEYYLIEQEGSRYPEFETARRCLDAWKTMAKTS